MKPAPTDTAPKPSARNQALYRTLVQEAAAGGTALMGKLVAAARLALQTQEAALRDLRERDVLSESATQLRRHEPLLCSRYPEALMQAFTNPDGGKAAPKLSFTEVQFDQLELMDEAQVLSSVTLARIQQVAMQVAEASLAELNTLMSSLQGLSAVRADANPLRPEAYVNALKEVVAQTGVNQTTQLLWFNAMCATMGQELRAHYTQLCARMRKDGIVAVAYAPPSMSSVGGSASSAGAAGGKAAAAAADTDAAAAVAAPGPRQTAAAGAAAAQPGGLWVHGRDEALLTLDKLRKLLSGELQAGQSGSRVEQFAAQFAAQFEGDARSSEESTPDFDGTVPAALEALTEMKQVERVVQSLEQRRGNSARPSSASAHSVEGQRSVLRGDVRDIAQALSLEVVTLMVDNMARDPRLLEPVRQVIRNLEPALLRLALVDPRFFTDKQHPARRLIQELTHRSMAFESSSAQGFDQFLQGLHDALAPLLQAPIEGAEVFEAKLASLQQLWNRGNQSQAKDREAAVEILQHAEARNLLAEKIAQSIETHKDSAKVPPVVIEFLCGPWAQVVAQARIKQGAGSAAAERYEALIPALLWSAHPDLARANPSKLTRVVPRLLATLRDGLETIHYPGTRTSVFLEALMAIHQTVFRSVSPKPGAEVLVSRPADILADRVRPVADGNPWMAPEEALASNFVELQDSPPEPDQAAALVPADAPIVPVATVEAVGDFPLGSWVQMWVNEQWLRTQLTWASPHGTLFLFTSVFGTTQSMTRRSRDKLLASGKLRLISGQAVDEGALDAVAQIAMRNSVDSADSAL